MSALLKGAFILVVYFAAAAGIALVCRWCIRIPDELFRKILHCILLGSLLVFVFGFALWWHAAVAAVGFAVVVYPVLMVLEKLPGFSRLTTERSHGELKRSLLLVFGMFAVVITICWGWLQDIHLVLASVYAWGFGDAAAALIGKRWGKHKVHIGPAAGKKTVEGSLAMFIVSFASVLVTLLCRGGMSVPVCCVISLSTALFSAVAELYAKDGNDTVVCPLTAMVVLLSLVTAFGGLT